jgi:hypothetical protein
MDETTQAKKSVSSALLLTVFMLVGLVIIVFAVRTYEARLEVANAEREAQYAAEYAAVDEAAAETATTTEDAVTEEAAPAETAPAE